MTNRQQGGGGGGCRACGGAHVKHTCAKARPPGAPRRPAVERELTFDNPGPRNVPGFCEGCEVKRREISVQKRAADTKDKTIARQAKRIRTLLRKKRELVVAKEELEINLQRAQDKTSEVEGKFREQSCWACRGWNLYFPHFPVSHTCAAPVEQLRPSSSPPSSPSTSASSSSPSSSSYTRWGCTPGNSI